MTRWTNILRKAVSEGVAANIDATLHMRSTPDPDARWRKGKSAENMDPEQREYAIYAKCGEVYRQP